MSDLVHAYQNRTRDYTVGITFSSGVLASDDVVRIKIGKNGTTPDLDIGSDEITPNGSRITYTNGSTQCTLRLAQDDTAGMQAGIAYDLEVCVVDGAETSPENAIKFAETGVLFLHPTLGGEDGIERSSSSSGSSESSSGSSSS